MIQSRNWQPKPSSFSQRKQRILFFLALSILITVLLYIECVGPFDQNAYKPSTSKGSAKILTLLPNEKRFLDTFKSCLSPQKCFQHIPNGSHVQRIAILSPPGTLFNEFFDILKKALLVNYNNSMEEMNGAIELLPSSHVPPYGYGKNHGLTKIVRLHHSSIITQVMDTLQFQKQQQRQPMSLENLASDASQTMRQVIRWHCRLSHVAAHTALINVNLSALDVKELKRIVDFIVTNPGNDPLDLKEGKDPSTPFPKFSILDNPFVDTNILRWFQSNDGRSDMDHVLSDELKTTKDLSQWPCLSFWRKGTNNKDEKIDDDIHERLAKKMVPKCSEPFVKCSVKFDRCEENGDIPCR